MKSFFFNDTATPEIYTLSRHDALPICPPRRRQAARRRSARWVEGARSARSPVQQVVREVALGPEQEQRSEEHTSELQSRQYLVCRLLLDKKKQGELCTVCCNCFVK